MSADWKTRQFVPDSDDDSEEEILESYDNEKEDNPQRGHDESKSTDDVHFNEGGRASNKAFLESSMLLSQTADSDAIEKNRPGRDGSVHCDVEASSNVSSALSSIASTPSISPHPVTGQSIGTIPELSRGGDPADTRDVQSYHPNRRFRERKAIQLNPYAIEGQMYKQVWKARGLVPLQVRGLSQREEGKDADASSSEVEEESQSADEILPVRRSSSELDFDRELEYNPRSVVESEEFPDLQNVSRLLSKSAQRHGTKRRKLAHTYSKRNAHFSRSTSPSKTFHVRNDGWIDVPFAYEQQEHLSQAMHEDVRNPIAKDSTYQANISASTHFPSPIRTSPSIPIGSPAPHSSPWGDYNDDDNATPPQLPTPITSSVARPHQEKHGQYAELQADPVQTQYNWISSDSSGSSDAEDAEGEELTQLVKAQRRTRGVLPASWHRLEYQKLLKTREQAIPKSTNVDSARRIEHAPQSRESKKGVAKRITKTRPDVYRDVDVATSLPMLIESEDDNTPEERFSRDNQQQMDKFITIDDNDSDDNTNMEDNSIDIMAGGNRRVKNKRSRTQTRSKQTKIRDTQSVQPRGVVDDNDDRNKGYRASIGHTRKHKRTTLSTPKRPKVGILDSTRGMTRAQTPNFLVFAARTARQRADQGRHSPTRKHIRLHNVQDTHEVSRAIRNWGIEFGESENRQTSTRQPLHERSTNQPQAQCFWVNDDVDDEEQVHPASLAATRAIAKTGNASSPAKKPAAATRPYKISDTRKAVQKGHPITSAVRPSYLTAPAQLETENLASKHNRTGNHERKLVLSRFLQSNINQTRSSPTPPTTTTSRNELAYRAKKRQPRQLSIVATVEVEDAFQPHENSHNLPDYGSIVTSQPLNANLTGLLPVGANYPTAFGLERLPDGLLFSSGTLLGSGLFAQSLRTKVDHGTQGPMYGTLNSSPIIWDGWNESIAEQIFRLCQNVVRLDEDHSSNPADSLKMVINYFSRHLRFTDPIDRKDFAGQWLSRLYEYNEEIGTQLKHNKSTGIDGLPMVPKVALLAVISDQVRQLTDHSMIDQEMKESISDVSLSILRKTLQFIGVGGLEDLRSFSKDTVQMAHHASRSRCRHKTEMFVVILHLLRSRNCPSNWLWNELKEQAYVVVPKIATFPTLELVWRDIFSLLPLFEIGSTGTVSRHATRQSCPQDWTLIKQLINPVFHACSFTGSETTINRYCQSLYARCFHLIDYWDWVDCESIIVFLFDFFAQRGLHDIGLEAYHNSPTFLSNLTSTTILAVRDSDRCFDILLKIIGRALKVLRSRLTGRKIGNIVWRLTPNHDRRLPKDQNLRQEDLDAVQNHLDLLAVLYWSAPPEHRIRVDTIRKLIDIEDSHLEVCHLVIRTWSNLVSFQLSTQESVDRLDPFVDWLNEIVRKALQLHRLARSEVEADARAAQVSHGHHFTKAQQENTIRQSQRHAESILLDALSSLEKAINRMEPSAANLNEILPSCLKDVFELYDVAQPKASPIMFQLLQVVQAWTVRVQQSEDAEDSQGYGDWVGIEDLVPAVELPQSMKVPEDLAKALQDFVSSLFGSDSTVEDRLLQKLLDCWLHLLSIDIKAGHLQWDDLIGPYGSRSWTALRDTPQTRKYGPLFYSRLITNDPRIYERNKAMLLQYWVGSLMERESLIKYQPELTTALLNQDRNDSLLQNLPFSMDNGVYSITLTDFSTRRLSLISCLLSNMRESFSFSNYHQLQDRHEKRKTYSGLLRHVMNTMKNNYRGLGGVDEVRGDYATFVHKIVQFLQEQTSDICKVDEFFLDAINIPLPASDPEYLLGKLGHLTLQLSQSGGAQKLAAFIQSLCERAVVEERQMHYASLLTQAIEDSIEDGQERHFTLRSFLCCQLIPVYVDSVANTSCGWIIADTLLLSLSAVSETLLLQVDPLEISGMTTVQTIVINILDNLRSSMPDFLELFSNTNYPVLVILTRYFEIIRATLAASDYVCRFFPGQYEHLTDIILYSANSALYLLGLLQHSISGLDPPEVPFAAHKQASEETNRFGAARNFIKDSLLASLEPSSHRCKWRLDNNRLYVHRKDRWELIRVDLSDTPMQKTLLVEAIKRFLSELRTLPSFEWIVNAATFDAIRTDLYDDLTSNVRDINEAQEHDVMEYGLCY